MGPVRGYAQSNARQQAGGKHTQPVELASSAILTELRTGRKPSKYGRVQFQDIEPEPELQAACSREFGTG
jgi:hypothetical protein